MYQAADENVTKRFARTLSYLSTRNNSSVFANSSLPVMVYNMCVCVSCSVISNCLQLHGLQPTRLLCPWNSPGKNTGVGCQSLLQGIFLTQGLNLGLLHCRQILYYLSLQGSLTYNITIANKKRSYLIKSAAYKGLLRGLYMCLNRSKGINLEEGRRCS